MTQAMPAERVAGESAVFTWPHDDTMRVPYRVYTDPNLYQLEQKRIFQGPPGSRACSMTVACACRTIMEYSVRRTGKGNDHVI